MRYLCAAPTVTATGRMHDTIVTQACLRKAVVMTPSFPPAGVGIRLRPQFLSRVAGCVFHPATAQEEPLCWHGTQRGQTQLLHPLLLCMMHLFISAEL